MKNIIVKVELESEVNELCAKTRVTQRFTNILNDPLELKIFLYKKNNLLFSSFSAKIGDSVLVNSKVIKKEKAKEKYNDSIASGNAAIFVREDPYDENKLIINMGNIPPKEEVVFVSNYLSLVETSKDYEFELFRNLPIFAGNEVIYHNSSLEGIVCIKTRNKNRVVRKEILMDNLRIVKEKYENKENNNYCIEYKIDNLPNFNEYYLDYIPSSKIFFQIENDEKPIAYRQKSTFDRSEQNYFIQYKIKKCLSEENKDQENPALFIFLIDQSGSMSGSSIKIAANALKLFIQSLPAKSYYQIIGFGTKFRKYNEVPKKYNQKNIEESIRQIEQLRADLGGTDIYSPLKFVYESNYENIDLPKNIFLLTDGEISDKSRTLQLIEKNSNNFSVYSIGIGYAYDKDLIKNAGILGKGNYNFCNNLKELNSIIATEISKAIAPIISHLEIKTSLDQNDIIKNNKIKNIIREDEIINLNYVVKEDKNENIKIDVIYLDEDKKIEKSFDIVALEIPEGEEFSKLIYNNYLLNSISQNEKENIALALKYQILTKNTSLFAEIELSEKVAEEMKSVIIGNKKENIIYQNPERELLLPALSKLEQNFDYKYSDMANGMIDDEDFDLPLFESDGLIEKTCSLKESLERGRRSREEPPKIKKEKEKDLKKRERSRERSRERFLERRRERNREKEINEESKFKKRKDNSKIELKDDVMKIINTQNFVEGFWRENEKTLKIKEKFKKEYDLIKNFGNKNINDDVAITIIIIYFIYKEHSELLKELERIIKKAKLFIKRETKMTYDKIIKDIGIN